MNESDNNTPQGRHTKSAQQSISSLAPQRHKYIEKETKYLTHHERVIRCLQHTGFKDKKSTLI